ncbi:hypothetical protein [Gordonia sp. NPDC003585]|uniref:hypothetical protein n=1 Tax=unclassified Gordonia (in: high G+C Gram-positive bacteria) TaxID=2657482 RepID=UPI0033B447E4
MTAGITPRLSFWLRVREFAVPPTMIHNATDRRLVGDWMGACVAAHVDVDLDLYDIRCRHGNEIAEQIRADLLCLAPDLLRWHMPRVAPDGLLRSGLTVALARYGDLESRFGTTGSTYLVARTPPAWADAGQRISLTTWCGPPTATPLDLRHPHPKPNPRFRLDLHRCLWDATMVGDLRMLCGAGTFPRLNLTWSEVDRAAGYAVDRWPSEAANLLRAHGHPTGRVRIRLDRRNDLIVDVDGRNRQPRLRLIHDEPRGRVTGLPVLPDAATRTLPDRELLETGALTPARLHPLVADALAPGWTSESGASSTDRSANTQRENHIHYVNCRGRRHRIGLVDGVLSALDHDPDEIRREELLTALTGTPVPCLQAIDRAHRRPDCLTGVSERLDHGDVEGAMEIVTDLLGAESRLRSGPLDDALRIFSDQRDRYEAYRSGTEDAVPLPCRDAGSRGRRRRSSRTRRR